MLFWHMMIVECILSMCSADTRLVENHKTNEGGSEQPGGDLTKMEILGG